MSALCRTCGYTAQQGDRRVDELTSSRVLLQTCLPYLAHLADLGGGDRMVGRGIQGSQALAGSSVVA